MKKLKEKILTFSKTRGFDAILPEFERDEKLRNELISLVSSQAEYPFSEYASWLATHLAKRNPQLLTSNYPELIEILLKSKNQSVLRNILNSVFHMGIQEYKESEFIDLLFNFILDKSHKVALHVYSMYVLANFIKKYPELKDEFLQTISLNSANTSPAYSAGIRKVQKILKNI